ncbi:acetyltransferase [Butyricimonas virosa]|uniref:acetyltransferase n=1 Tax=Butyricimonas virosa TaxID=544645 RepID=UPI0022E7B6FE|nr:acetyltransferase [Butyricimonas virosa]
MKDKNLILVGGGGHCKSVIDVAESAGFHILGILDKPTEQGKNVFGYRIIGTDDDMVKYINIASFIVTVGQINSPALRMKLHQMIENVGGKFATIIASTAYVSRYASIGEGTVIMHNAFINADAKVGKGCIINTFANIEHEVELGNFCHVSTGSIINGGSKIGCGVFIGSHSTVFQGVRICLDGGMNTLISAASVVKNDIVSQGVYWGNPAIKVK